MSDLTQTRRGMVQAVIFDLDGVLVDTEWLAFEGWRKLAEAHGGQLNETAFPGMVGLTAEETALHVMEHAQVTFDVAKSVAWAWQWVIDHLKAGADPIPGAAGLVRELDRRGYPLAIASNSIASYIDTALVGLKLGEYFPVRVSSEQVALGKPAPDVYLRAAALLGADPERCLAVEDSRVGVQAAAAAGMRVIAVPGAHDHHNGFHGAWRVVDSMDSLVKTIDQILL